MLTAKHISTLRGRLGAISDQLDDQYLPMFRNRQINYPDLWDFSVKLSAKKDNPGRYLAKLWGRASLKKSIDWLSRLINAAKSKVMEKIREVKAKKDAEKEQEIANIPMNREMRRRFERMKLDFRLPT